MAIFAKPIFVARINGRVKKNCVTSFLLLHSRINVRTRIMIGSRLVGDPCNFQSMRCTERARIKQGEIIIRRFERPKFKCATATSLQRAINRAMK